MKNPAKILVVDDTQANAKLLTDLLAFHGYEVVTAASGAEALEKVKTDHPDLVLLDIIMPGMNGYEVCQKLKASPITQNIQIVAISGDHNPAVRDRILSAGADLFFTKPLEIIGFRDRCLQLLES